MLRNTKTLKEGFKFKKYALGEADAAAFTRDFDDIEWRKISIPHDFGIEGDFCAENDPSYRKIVEDGMEKSVYHTGRTGGLPIVGEGIYRTWVTLDEIQNVFLELDGVMWESYVYVNGKKAGGNHFGYLSYEVDITDYVVPGANLIAIHAIVPTESSRWYSGGGIYRNVRLVTKPREYICYNGVAVRQIYADSSSALFDITVTAKNAVGFTAKIKAPDGKVSILESEDDRILYSVDDPMLWDIDNPKLYTAEITLKSGDSTSVRFGARSLKFTEEGFFLNGRYLKMRGVCMHHDMGMIGAAVNRSALLRQIEILKGMGVNAIRTSHNPPAPELLDLCDEQGILVMDEFFDEWSIPKVANAYSKHFDEHAISDARQIIMRDRNHPCVIMWSLGNEIAEQYMPDGWKIARKLNDAVHQIDPTRPTIVCCNWYPECIDAKFAFYADILGLNYKPYAYSEIKKKHPDVLLIGSETASCVSTRGAYDLPAAINIGDPKNEELTISDYGLCGPAWAYYAERELAAQEDCKYVMGEFIWTGFDYLGEPTPYYTEWPSRSSYFGVVDLAGLAKNRYYCYRAAWTDLPTLHIFPHWNWEGYEGKNVPIHIYTNYDEVELFINGVSQGKRHRATSGNDEYAQLGRFRLMWNDTVYEQGEILAVAYKNGVEKERKIIRTASAPYRIELSEYSKSISADGESLNYVTARILDKDGNLCPSACNRLTFSASGAAFVYATDAGDQRETETFLRPDKKALSGMLVCCLKSNGKKGEAAVLCSSAGLISGSATFECI